MRTAIIFGASRGLGASVADELAARGWSLVMAARSWAELERRADAITAASGGRVIAVRCDITRFEDTEHAAHVAMSKFGSIDMMINCAAEITPIAPLADSDPSAWAQAATTNVMGCYHGIRAVLPAMREQGHGVIVNVSSGASRRALVGWSGYCAGKAAVEMLTQCALSENPDAGISFMTIDPGTIDTDMQAHIRASGLGSISQMRKEDHQHPAHAASRLVEQILGERLAS